MSKINISVMKGIEKEKSHKTTGYMTNEEKDFHNLLVSITWIHRDSMNSDPQETDYKPIIKKLDKLMDELIECYPEVKKVIMLKDIK
jgi:hypothetical protein